MDAYTELRAASVGNLTADETLTDFDLTAMAYPLYLHAIVPAVSSGDTLVVKANFDNVSNTTLQTTSSPSISAAGHYVVPIFCDHPDLSDLSVVLDVTKNDTVAANFGAVVVYISNSRIS